MQPSGREAPVTCAACGRKVARKSRQQKFCSDRCRKFACRELAARTAIKNPSGHQDSGRVTNPHFFSSKDNGLQGRKSGSSIPFNVLGGYRWSRVLEAGVVQNIVRAEIGALSQLNSAKEAA